MIPLGFDDGSSGVNIGDSVVELFIMFFSCDSIDTGDDSVDIVIAPVSSVDCIVSLCCRRAQDDA